VIGWAFVGVSLGFVVLLVIRQGGELPRLRADLELFGWTFRPGWLTAALALGTADLVLMGWVWVLLFRSLGGRVGAGEGIRVWMTTNLGRYIPGKIWQLSGLALYMRERRGAGAAALTAAGLYQALVLGTGVAVAASTLGGQFLADGALLPTIILLGALLVVLLQPSIASRISTALASRFDESPPEAPLGRGALWAATSGLVAAWLVNGLGLWCVWRGAGGSVDPGPLTMAGVYSAAYVAGYIVLFAPGGLVVREGALAALLAVTAGVPASVGVAVAILARLWTTATELLGVGIVWAWRAARGESIVADVTGESGVRNANADRGGT
jgi:uncharacterized membrane protein YbhN (UPF0104 family)